ncbi:MAG: hypothetical protein JSS43_18270, partial [Proteobacteria bacterium]|nr:hypothetical protein [Pseudomonadota bacterium]
MSEITHDGWRHMPRGRTPAAAPNDRPGTLQIIGTMTNGALVAATLLIVGAAGGVLLDQAMR